MAVAAIAAPTAFRAAESNYPTIQALPASI